MTTLAPHAEAIRDALGALVEAFDKAKADGLTIPPAAATGVATLGVACHIVAGQEAERGGLSQPEGVSLFERLSIAVPATSALPPAFRRS